MLITLKVKNYSELVVNLAVFSQLLQFSTDFLAELGKLYCLYENPWSWSCTFFNQSYGILVIIFRNFFVWIIKFLPEGILYIIKFGDRDIYIRAYVPQL